MNRPDEDIIGTKPVVIVLMDTLGKFPRIGDANRIKKWIESGKATATLSVAPAMPAMVAPALSPGTAAALPVKAI